MERGNGIDTTTTSYWEDDEGKTRYVRIVRVFYTCPLQPMGEVADVPTGLTLKNFLPAQTQGGTGCCETFDFEKATPSRERLAAWFRVSGKIS